MTNKSLSEKRKELFEEVFDKKIEKELFVIFNCIADQDKEAIKEEEKLILSLFKSWEIDEDVIKSFIVQRDKIFGEIR